MFQRKMNEIPRRKKNYSYNSHLTEHDIFNTYDNKEKLKQASSIETKTESIESLKLDNFHYHHNKLNPLNIKTPLLRQNESLINHLETLNKCDIPPYNNNHNYNVINTEPTFNENIQSQIKNSQNRPSSVKVNVNLPPLDSKKFLREKSLQGQLPEIVVEKDNSNKSRNQIDLFSGNDKFSMPPKKVRIIRENSFAIEKNNNLLLRNYESNISNDNLAFIERTILKPNYPMRVMKIKKDLEQEDLKTKNYIHNVLSVEKEKKKEYDEFLKKNMISLNKKECYSTKKLYFIDDKLQYLDDNSQKITSKPLRQDSYLSNQNRDDEENMDEQIRNQENQIKKYYKEYLLTQMVDNLENKKTPAGNMKINNIKKLNFYKNKLKEEKEDRNKLSNSHAI